MMIIGRKDNADAWWYLAAHGWGETWTRDRKQAKRYADRKEAVKAHRCLREKWPDSVWIINERDNGKIEMDVTFNVTVTIEIEPGTTYSETIETAAPRAAEKLRLFPMDAFERCEPTPN